MNQHRAGIGELKALAFGVALRSAARLGTDRGQFASRSCGMGEPGLEQEGLHPPIAVARQSAIPADQGDVIVDEQ